VLAFCWAMAWETLLVRNYVPKWEIFFRFLVALLFGAVVGIDREMKNRPAGLRTHMLTALAASVVAVVTLELGVLAAGDKNYSDPVRALEAVTAGVAFLAAGTIIQARGSVAGLTTGASMWLAGVIGFATGFGFIVIAAAATIGALIVLVGLQRLANRINPSDG
jgi:putative Mg2+ transporter-C (MgtC) family protein